MLIVFILKHTKIEKNAMWYWIKQNKSQDSVNLIWYALSTLK